jgi:transposase
VGQAAIAEVLVVCVGSVKDRDFQAKILGIERPWLVDDVVVTMQPKTVETHVSYDGPAACPVCGKPALRYDLRERRWRYLDIYEFEAYVIAQVLRVECPNDGVRRIKMPWADGRSGFTALFERLALTAARDVQSPQFPTLRLSWDQIDGIMQRSIDRGLALRKDRIVKHIVVDEKSSKKRHQYVTIVTDLDASEVIWVGSGRKLETVDAF